MLRLSTLRRDPRRAVRWSACMPEHDWPELPYEAWKDTLATLHMKLQIVGKLRLALSPFEPEGANVALYLTSRGLTTGPMSSGGLIFGIDADLVAHQVVITTVSGDTRHVALVARPVAAFYKEFTTALDGLGIQAKLRPVPDEVSDPIPFAEDTVHSAYDSEWANRFFQVLARADLVLQEHRSRFRGRTSPVHFLLGQLRPGQHALLRPHRGAAPGRRSHRSQVRGRRADLRGVLAGQRDVPRSRLLLVHLSQAGWTRGAADRAVHGKLGPEAGRVRASI